MFAMPNSTVIPYKRIHPQIGSGVLIASGAHVIGDVVIGAESSIWFNAVIRGDCNYIRIGAKTNVQDGTVIHVTHSTAPTHIGTGVTIGHGVIIHGCTIDDECLIGMGSVILDKVQIPKHSLVAAGSLVTPGKTFPPGHLILGSPAKAVRPLSENEIKGIQQSIDHYIEYKKHYMPV